MGIADVDAPPTIVDALEEDLTKNTGEIGVVEAREANVFGLHGELQETIKNVRKKLETPVAFFFFFFFFLFDRPMKRNTVTTITRTRNVNYQALCLTH